jgi:hypothetical protein
MVSKHALLVATLGLLEGLAVASCVPGYAGSGYYRQRDCGLRLGPRAYSSPGYAYGYGYGYGYGNTIDSFIPTLPGPALYYGYPASLPYVPNWYAAPYLGQPYPGGRGAVPGLRYSPRSSTRVRPQRRFSAIRPGLRAGFATRFAARARGRNPRHMARLSSGVWINE